MLLIPSLETLLFPNGPVFGQQEGELSSQPKLLLLPRRSNIPRIKSQLLLLLCGPFSNIYIKTGGMCDKEAEMLPNLSGSSDEGKMRAISTRCSRQTCGKGS